MTGRNKDFTESSSEREDEKATRIARELESDDANEGARIGHVDTPEGDDAAENRIETSLDDE